MSHRVESKPPVPGDPATEMGKLTSIVRKWGMEAGFLGLEDDFEPRLAALVVEAAARLYGNAEADLGRLRSELDSVESEWDQAAHRVAAYRSRFGAAAARGGWWNRLRAWFWDFRECRAARTQCKRREPVLAKTRLELAAAERKARQAQEWREIATRALRAQYEFEKARAACLRPEKEMTYDRGETRHFVLHGAN
jgi:hypothetical protein